MDHEHDIRQRAYMIWQSEGCPAGCEQEHWDRAVREIENEAGAGSANDGAEKTMDTAKAAAPTASAAPVSPDAKPKRPAKSTKPAAARAPRRKSTRATD